MGATIAIRREDKNEWERRVPLIPADLADLRRDHGLEFLVQTSPIRIHTDDEYRAAGAAVVEDIDAADVVLAVKEIPTRLLRAGRVYVYFAHVIKGQPQNMPMLARLLELGATLIDYEKIADDQGRRLIFFSLHAGYAGMIETLWAWGQRLNALGTPTPLLAVRRAYEYGSLETALAALRDVGAELHRAGAAGLRGDAGGEGGPRVLGIAGYGNVARGCHAILAALQVPAVAPAQLLAGELPADLREAPLVQVEFRESDMVAPVAPDGVFALQDYYDNPQKYRGDFARFLPHLDCLVNTIFWDTPYPRLVTRAWARENFGPGRSARLQVIGDISCDIEGSIELTLKATMPDAPCFVYDPATDTVVDGVAGDGPVVMAVDNLPCELPRESSTHFSTVLRDMIPDLARADWRADLADLELPAYLARAVITHKGSLAPAFAYLREHLPG
jgi:alpha-aminoadipic semialdehyde synthase